VEAIRGASEVEVVRNRDEIPEVPQFHGEPFDCSEVSIPA
jgi:hypothetical protein